MILGQLFSHQCKTKRQASSDDGGGLSQGSVLKHAPSVCYAFKSSLSTACGSMPFCLYFIDGHWLPVERLGGLARTLVPAPGSMAIQNCPFPLQFSSTSGHIKLTRSRAGNVAQ